MKRNTILILAIALSLTACKQEQKKTTQETPQPQEAKQTTTTSASSGGLVVRLEPKSDSQASGVAIFAEDANGVRMVSKFEGLTPGTHAIHLHEKADCSAADGTSTGGHWNPTFEKHGAWGDPKGYHRGDLGNFKAQADGSAKFSFQTDQWCVGCGDPQRDIVGKAVIIHQGTDDYTSQPSGAAGARVSCGGIIK
ncbi:MAG: superoxide dismutase [Cryomorphaceae bacterium BACL21 MAG-121220-bin10]|jgi:superoxide dismutase, Cu-Zn family|nr:MAG: superoxide dismutase [Cryomorphaceae bacterium BACL21 MAG-121220-bin10]